MFYFENHLFEFMCFEFPSVTFPEGQKHKKFKCVCLFYDSIMQVSNIQKNKHSSKLNYLKLRSKSGGSNKINKKRVTVVLICEPEKSNCTTLNKLHKLQRGEFKPS